MIGLSVGLNLSRQIAVVDTAETTQLAANEWVLEEADVGDTGTTGEPPVERGPVTLATDIGRMRVRFLRPSAVSGSEWGVYFGSSSLPILSVGDTVAEASSQAVGAGAGSLELLRNPRMTDPTTAQVLYREVAGTGDWTVASTSKTISPTARTTALIEADWNPTVIVSGGSIIVYLDATDTEDPTVLASSDFVAFSTLSSPSASTDSDWTTATLTALSGGVLGWVLPGLDTAGATISNLRVIHQVSGLKTSNFSNVYPDFDLPDVPASFTSGQATLTDPAVSGGLQLTLEIVTLPDSGGTPLTAIEYQVSSDNVTYGSTVEISPSLGAYSVAVSANNSDRYVRVRAKNALGSSASWLVLGPVQATNGAAAASELVMSPTRTTLPVGAAVHFEPTTESLEALASEWSVSGGAEELLRNGYFLTTFSADGDEDYAWERNGIVPRAHAWTAGSAIGPYVAHQYRKAGTHAPTTTLYYGANTATWTGSLTVQALDTAYTAATNIRVFSSANDFTGLPSAYSGSTQMTNFADAIAWVKGGTNRCLLLKGGETLTWTNAMGRADLRSGCYIGTWNGTRVTINMSSDIETITRLDLKVTATAGQTEFTFSPLPSRTTRSVFVDDALADPADYTFSGTDPAKPDTLTFDTGLTEGAVVRVIGNMGTAENPVILGATFPLFRFRNVADGTVLNLDFRGNYDQANPITFDGVDYSTYEHTQNILPFDRQGGNLNITIAQCSSVGLHAFNIDNINEPTSNGLFLIDNYVEDWRNYGFYPGDHQRDSLVGCTMVGNVAGVTGGSKTFSGVGVSNAVAHGGVRWSGNDKSAIHHNISGSFASWSVDPQPAYRLAQKTTDGQSYSFSENEGWHSTNVSAGGGAGANGDLPSPIGGVFLVESNVHCFGAYSVTGTATPQYMRCRNNLWVVPSTDFQNAVIAIYGRDASGDKWYNGGAIDLPDIYNETVFAEESRTSTFYLSGVQELQSAGLSGAKGNLYTAVGGETSITITGSSAQEPQYGFGSTWRLWRSQDSGATWVEIGQEDDDRRVTLEPAGDRNAIGKQWVHPGTGSGILDGWTLTINAIGSLGVAFDGLTLSSGDQIRLTWNPTLDRAGVTFFPNNIPETIGREPGVFENGALIVDGTFAAIVDREGYTTVDPATVTTAAAGPFTSDFIPASGSDYYQTATTGRVALRDYFRAVRSSPSKGAFEPGSDVSSWTIPLTVPTFGWAASYTDGETVDADSIVTTAGSDATLTIVSKTITVTRGGSPLTPASSYVVAEGDVLTASVVYGHILTGRATASVASQTVGEAVGYSPQTTRNSTTTSSSGAGAMQWTGVEGASLSVTDPVHFAFRGYMIASTSINADVLFAVGGSGANLRINPSGWVLVRSGTTALMNTADCQIGVGSANAASFLITWYPGVSGSGSCRVIKDGVEVGTATNTAASAFVFERYCFLTNTAGGTGGASTPNMAFVGGVCLATGGTPTFSDFFEADNSPKDYEVVTVSGMTKQFIFRDTADFTTPTNRGAYDHGASGFPQDYGTFTS